MKSNRLRCDQSEEKLEERMHSSLKNSGYRQLRNIRCEADGSTAILKGRLQSFYLLQIAQTVATNVPGVRRVVNEVKVSAS